jgi:ABC-type Fe3+/spermidine/putrescine transport system ATPase subunit
MAATHALEVTGARVQLGQRQVLDGIDLTLPAGQVLALLGASGCGKTTLLRSIAGLTALDQGIVTVAGRDITALPAQQRGLGVVFQHYALFPNLSVQDNVEFGVLADGHAKAEAARRAQALLQLVDLTEHTHKRPSQLSGGQRQRVALARALARHPALLLMDEPFSALDENFRVPLRRAFRHLQRELGQSSLIVTHDREEAFELADQVAVMFDGRIAQCGSPAELWQRPGTRQVANFLGAFNLLPADLAPGTMRRDTGCWASPIAQLLLRDAPSDLGGPVWQFDARVEASYFAPQHTIVVLRGPNDTALTLWRPHAAEPLHNNDLVRLALPSEGLQYLS